MHPSVRIRHSRPADLAKLAAVERSAAHLFAGTHAHDFADGPTTHPQTLAQAHQRGLLWISEHDGAPGGLLVAEPCPEGLYIREVSVAAAAQRRGHGKALIAAAIAHARRHALAAVLLTTDRNLPWNAPFYARLGFVLCDSAAMPATARHRLARQLADGQSAAHRCAMILSLHYVTK